MRKWGIVISLVYALIVVGLLVPAAIVLTGGIHSVFFHDLADIYLWWGSWIPIVAVVACQVVLLFLPVDTSEKRLKPRGPVLQSVVIGSTLLLLLTSAAVLCVVAAIHGDDFGKGLPGSLAVGIGTLAGIWAAWAVSFFLYLRNKTEIAKRLVPWLLRGSILELLIAVPCHVIVRRRQDCSAPVVTSFGIVTGIAVMLLAFGPSVMLLYKKRLDAYRRDAKVTATE